MALKQQFGTAGVEGVNLTVLKSCNVCVVQTAVVAFTVLNGRRHCQMAIRMPTGKMGGNRKGC